LKKYLLSAGAALFASACLLIPSAPLGISAQSAILTDLDSGRILYEKNSGERRAIASITKIMTALVALEHCDLEELVTVSYESTITEGSSMYLKPGEILSMEELLYGLMLASGNDAALAVAQHCAGSVDVFVGWMNEKARHLRMNDTQFKNPNGLDEEGHYSTAADMAKLTAAAMNNDAFVRIVSTKTITIGTRSLKNHNKLLWEYEGILGVKTGYTGKAGRTLVSCASRDGQRLIAVTLSDRNDWADHAFLFDYGFQTYPKTVLCKAAGRWGKSRLRGG
jgi:D-alanyl-D-alanine carboxypeptidase (penicillin-binding protein 5/6)